MMNNLSNYDPRWCDGMYNTHYGTAIERMRERRWGNAPTVIEAEEVYGQYTDTAGNFR